MAKRGTPNFGSKVGDAYIEVHSEFDRKSAAKVEKEMAAAAEKSQKDLNLKRVRNDKEYIQRAHADAIRMEQKRIKDVGRIQSQAYAENRKRTILNEKRLQDELRKMRKKRYKDGGAPGLAESFENVISVLPGQLEKLFRSPQIAGAAVVAGGVVGTELIGGAAAVLAAGTSVAVLTGGLVLAFKKDAALQEAGKAVGKQFIDGLEQTALNQLKPKILESLGFLEKANVGGRIASNFEMAFAKLATKLPGLTSNIAETIDGITQSIGDFVSSNPQLIDQVGEGFKQLGNATESVFNVLKDNGPALKLFLGDMLATISGAVRGIGFLVKQASNIRLGFQDVLEKLHLADKRPQGFGNDDQLAGDIQKKQEKLAELQGRLQHLKDRGVSSNDSGYQNTNAKVIQAGQELSGMLGEQTKRWNENRSAQLDAAGATQVATVQEEAAAKVAQAHTDAINANIDAMKRQGDEVYNRQKSAIEYKNAEVALIAQFKGANDTISLNTKKGRENRSALVDQFKAARDTAQGIFETTGSADKANAAFKKLTDKTIANTGATGTNKTKMEEMRGEYDKFAKAPDITKTITITADIHTAMADIYKVQDAAARLKGAQLVAQDQNRRTGGVQKASGGPISGPGTGTSDSIPAMLSNGEYVIKASAAKKIGIANLNALNSGMAPVHRATGGMIGRYAKGGSTGRGKTGGQLAQFNALTKQIAALTSTIKIQTDKLGKWNETFTAASDQFSSFVNLGGLDTEGKTAGDVIAQLQSKKAKATQFAGTLNGLKSAGLSATALAQLQQAGPDSDIAGLIAGGTGAVDIGIINGLLGGAGDYGTSVAGTLNGAKPSSAVIKANQKKLAAKKKAAAKLKPPKASGATIQYAGGKVNALFSAKELQNQNLKTGTYVTVVIDGKEVRAIVKQEHAKTNAKNGRAIKSGRR